MHLKNRTFHIQYRSTQFEKTMKIKILTAYLLILSSCQGQSVYEDNKAEFSNCISCEIRRELEYPNQDYVETDIIRYREMVNPIANLKPSIKEYKKIYPSLLNAKGNTISDSIVLKDELKLIKHRFFGGYSNFQLSILAYNDLIINVRLELEVIYNIFENIYLKEITIPLTCFGNDMEYFQHFENNLKEYQKKYPNFILEADINKYSIESLNAFSFLNQIDWNIDAYHVDDEFIFQANLSSEHLLKNKEFELLEKVIFGINPVSRIYAYSAFERAEKQGYEINDELKTQMSKVKAESGLKFKSGILSCHIGKYDYDYYDFSIEKKAE